MSCVMRGLCNPVCPADIAPNLTALHVSRVQEAHLTQHGPGLKRRMNEIEAGHFDQEWKTILAMTDPELATYQARED